MKHKIRLEYISIVLVQPQIPENIGSVVRAMDNMGLTCLSLVNPENYDLSRVKRTATGSSIDLIEGIVFYNDLRAALEPYQYVIGTTTRLGSARPAMTKPRALAQDLISVSQKNRVAIVFGPEDRGLSNGDLSHCHTIATIPTARFSSLNLAQAVMLFCYEIFQASAIESPGTLPRLANSFELEGMYDHLKDVLTKIGFINPQNPEHWMLNIRRFLSRLPLRARDVRIIRGVCRQVDWYTEQLEKIRGDGDRG
jgi:tRNA/rRNA methyltransferase